MRYVLKQGTIEADLYIHGMQSDHRGICYCTIMMGAPHIHGDKGAKQPRDGDYLIVKDGRYVDVIPAAKFSELYEEPKTIAIRNADLMTLKGFADAKALTGVTIPLIVCLCGSTKFGYAFHDANLELTMRGYIVLSVGATTQSDAALMASGRITADAKVALDELHKRKIDLADVVFVLNVDDYIGESTRSEIDYSVDHSVPVLYLEERSATRSEQPEGCEVLSGA